MRWRVVFSDDAEADLAAIHDYVAASASSDVALRFVERIVAYCLDFSTFPERGTRRDDIRPRLRTIGFRRRATIMFEVDHAAHRVVIHGVLYGGRRLDEQDDDESD